MKEMQFTEHLEELRWRIIRALIYFLAGAVVCYIFVPTFFNYIKKPVGQLYFFSPPEAFLVRIKLSLLLSLFLTLPLIILEIWKFISPALYLDEKKKILPFVIFGIFLFYAGGIFSAILAYPLGMKVLLSFGKGFMEPIIGADHLFKIFFYLTLAFSILFETPIVVLILTTLGVISPETIEKRRREIIVGIFVIAAIITPSVDAITLLLISLPLYLLFEISIWISKRFK